MNRYQEALKFLGEYSLGCAVTNHKDDTIKVINDYRQTLQKLVDKATPKKVCPKWRTGYDPKLYYPKSFHCPSCGRKLRLDQFYKWCPDCNQALEKWSDEDDE
jgi:hypothetical protein